RARRCDALRRLRAAVGRRHHVFLGHAATGAGPADRREVDAAFARELAHERRERAAVGGLLGCGGRRGLLRLCGRFWFGLRSRRLLFGLRRLLGLLFGSLRLLLFLRGLLFLRRRFGLFLRG